MNRDILVLNAGSSSIKVSLFRLESGSDPTLELSGQIDGIGTPHPSAIAKTPARGTLFEERWPAGDGPRDHEAAMTFVVRMLKNRDGAWKPAAVGHRVVHGGVHYRAPTFITPDVHAVLKKLSPLAPLHLPPNLEGIDAATRAFPDAVQVACFDTSFHQGHPWVADTYALPRAMYEEGIRRYGFHGLSYAYIARAMKTVAPAIAQGRLVVAHLGNGASLCALRDGHSVDSTMGFTALDGLPMGTRSGQIDPGVLLYLTTVKRMPPEELMDLLYRKSGLLGLSGISSDVRDLLASDRPEAAQAVDYFVYRVATHVGALAAGLGGLDGVVFTGGIGENAALIRERVCDQLRWLGIDLDRAANEKHGPRITPATSKISAWVVPTNEEKMIAMYVRELISSREPF
ncbi:MAG: acetate/propionate family kinase [Planctomycetes bacterium]|nr:acetate/propionate family kinase [Planctomycetota bacterium]